MLCSFYVLLACEGDDPVLYLALWYYVKNGSSVSWQYVEERFLGYLMVLFQMQGLYSVVLVQKMILSHK